MSLTDEWVEVSPGNATLSATYADGYFVTTGGSGAIVYSRNVDGPWSTATSGTSETLYGAHYADGKWVVVGDRMTILTADTPAGPWSAATSSGLDTSVALYGVTFGDGKWATVGTRGRIYSATNPAGTWTERLNLTSGLFNAVAYGGGNFVAVGSSGRIRYAADAAGTWSVPSSGAGTAGETYTGVAYGDGDWLLVGNPITPSRIAKTATDPSGAWTAVDPGGAFSYYGFGRSVVYLDGNWIVTGPGSGGGNGTLRYATSPGGTWATVNLPAGVAGYSGIVYDGQDWGAIVIGGMAHQALEGDGWGLIL